LIEGRRKMNNSTLYDEKTFYNQFINDLLYCQREVLIESPFITSVRMKMLYPILEDLINRRINIVVVTRDPREHIGIYREQSEYEIQRFERLGIQPLLCEGNHHRKLAIIDRKLLWEGSLNILSQIHSREIMRRIDSKQITMEMFHFLKLEEVI
jgi:hypothetical protein